MKQKLQHMMFFENFNDFKLNEAVTFGKATLSDLLIYGQFNESLEDIVKTVSQYTDLKSQVMLSKAIVSSALKNSPFVNDYKVNDKGFAFTLPKNVVTNIQSEYDGDSNYSDFFKSSYIRKGTSRDAYASIKFPWSVLKDGILSDGDLVVGNTDSKNGWHLSMMISPNSTIIEIATKDDVFEELMYSHQTVAEKVWTSGESDEISVKLPNSDATYSVDDDYVILSELDPKLVAKLVKNDFLKPGGGLSSILSKQDSNEMVALLGDTDKQNANLAHLVLKNAKDSDKV